MEALRDRPLFTQVFEKPEEFSPTTGSAYIYGLFEERSEHIKSWAEANSTIKAVKITDQGRNTIRTDFAACLDVGLRSREQLSRFFQSLDCHHLYIDITGLSHHVWAPLIRVASERKHQVDVVYVEPGGYKHSPSPRRGEIFDLSEKIDGIAPIPLFTSLADSEQVDVCFVPLLGFEGARLRYMLEEVEPPGQKVVPIIGVPGFQLEYPFNAYIGNQPALEETRIWKNTRYARANCPFSLFYVLEDILREYPAEHVKIAPIGTKPHALGAILLAMTVSRSIELVYDHPKRKAKRTAGALRLLLYSLSDFLP